MRQRPPDHTRRWREVELVTDGLGKRAVLLRCGCAPGLRITREIAAAHVLDPAQNPYQRPTDHLFARAILGSLR